MSRPQGHVVLLTLLAGSVFLTNLGGPKLWDRDEPRNARCAAEMLQANDWVVPTFNGELRDHKPIMVYWGMMLSYSLFGVTEFAARFSSAVYGIGTVLLTWLIGARLFRPSAGLWAGIALSTTLMFSVAARAATPDAPLIFYTTLSLAVYVWGTTSGKQPGASAASMSRLYPESWCHTALMFAVMGLAVLAKGPVGLVLPTAVIGMFLLIERLPETEFSTEPVPWSQRLFTMLKPFAPLHFLKTCWAMRPFTAIMVAGIVAVPWFVWVHVRTAGAFTTGFFLTHNISRAVSTMEGHSGGPWFYPVALLIGFFPWSVFWLPMLLDVVRQCKERVPWRRGYVFACCWVGVYVGLFTIASTKLPSYITPCYPAVALLMGAFIDRIAQRELNLSALWHRLAVGSLITVGIGVAIGLPVAAHLYFQADYFLGALGLVLIVGGAWTLYSFEHSQAKTACYQLAGTAALFMVGVMGVITTTISAHRPVETMLSTIYHGRNPQQIDVASFGAIEPSNVFYCQQTIETLESPEETARFLQASLSDHVILTRQHLLDELTAAIPQQNLEITQLPDFLDQPGMVIVKHRPMLAQPGPLIVH